MSTKERILDASLALFNELGERKVTTNHIASHLQISPGNLYYHFKNKQAIIFALFERYEERVLTILQVPQNRTLQPMDKLNYLQAIFRGLWDFRFMHRIRIRNCNAYARCFSNSVRHSASIRCPRWQNVWLT